MVELIEEFKITILINQIFLRLENIFRIWGKSSFRFVVSKNITTRSGEIMSQDRRDYQKKMGTGCSPEYSRRHT